jgi:hypothetical protein
MKFKKFLNQITEQDKTLNADYTTRLQDTVFNNYLGWLPTQPITQAELTNLGSELKGTVPFVKKVSANSRDPKELDVVIENQEFKLGYITKYVKINSTTDVFGSDSVDVLLNTTLGKQYVKEIYKILERKIQSANRGVADESDKALFDAVAKNLTGDCVLIVNTANFNEIFEYIPQFKELNITLVFAELETYKYIVLDRNQIKLLYGEDPRIGIAEDMEDFLKNTLTLGLNALSDIAFNPMSISAIAQ